MIGMVFPVVAERTARSTMTTAARTMMMTPLAQPKRSHGQTLRLRCCLYWGGRRRRGAGAYSYSSSSRSSYCLRSLSSQSSGVLALSLLISCPCHVCCELCFIDITNERGGWLVLFAGTGLGVRLSWIG